MVAQAEDRPPVGTAKEGLAPTLGSPSVMYVEEVSVVKSHLIMRQDLKSWLPIRLSEMQFMIPLRSLS